MHVYIEVAKTEDVKTDKITISKTINGINTADYLINVNNYIRKSSNFKENRSFVFPSFGSNIEYIYSRINATINLRNKGILRFSGYTTDSSFKLESINKNYKLNKLDLSEILYNLDKLLENRLSTVQRKSLCKVLTDRALHNNKFRMGIC